MIVIHTAEIKPSAHERIISASLVKSEVLREARTWRKEYPGRKVTFKTIIERRENA